MWFYKMTCEIYISFHPPISICLSLLVVKAWVSNFLVTQGACPTWVTLTNHACFLEGPANPVLTDVAGLAARKDSY